MSLIPTWKSPKVFGIDTLRCSKWLLALLLHTACTTTPEGQVVQIKCKADTSQSYAIYIPIKKGKLPIIYFFDPHGDGALPVNKYKSLADSDGFILVGSNNSKNGNDYGTAEAIWQTLSKDVRERCNVDPQRIYLAGFSGGAKVAGYLVLQHPEIKNIIVGGAGLPDGTPVNTFPFGITILAGEGDMNMTDLVAFNTALDSTGTPHRLWLFDGIHEWAPSPDMGAAFAGLQLDAIREGLPVDGRDSIIRKFAKDRQAQIQEEARQGRLVKAMTILQFSEKALQGFPAQQWFTAFAADLAHNDLYQKEVHQRADMLLREENTKVTFQQHFAQMDTAYWHETIRDLDALADPHTPEGQMYQRELAFLSLAFYSISNRLIQSGNDDSAARYFVDLYKFVDPTNPEAQHFSEILTARGH